MHGRLDTGFKGKEQELRTRSIPSFSSTILYQQSGPSSNLGFKVLSVKEATKTQALN
jgi:hypothetical protein